MPLFEQKLESLWEEVEVEGCSSLWLTGKRENSHFPLEGKIPGKTKLWLFPLLLWQELPQTHFQIFSFLRYQL